MSGPFNEGGRGGFFCPLDVMWVDSVGGYIIILKSQVQFHFLTLQSGCLLFCLDLEHPELFDRHFASPFGFLQRAAVT